MVCVCVCCVLDMLTAVVAVLKMANVTRTHRLLAGLALLILVDIIWVVSSEITKVLASYILFCQTQILSSAGNDLRFYARQHICYSAYMLSPVRLSVCPSHGCIIEKRLKL